MRTLAEINATPRTHEWNGSYVLEHRIAVGRVGFARSGEKLHWLSTEVVIGYVGDFQPTFRQMKIGDVFSAYAACNGNGQHVGKVVQHLDTDAITCKKCGGSR